MELIGWIALIACLFAVNHLVDLACDALDRDRVRTGRITHDRLHRKVCPVCKQEPHGEETNR